MQLDRGIIAREQGQTIAAMHQRRSGQVASVFRDFINGLRIQSLQAQVDQRRIGLRVSDHHIEKALRPILTGKLPGHIGELLCRIGQTVVPPAMNERLILTETEDLCADLLSLGLRQLSGIQLIATIPRVFSGVLRPV